MPINFMLTAELEPRPTVIVGLNLGQSTQLSVFPLVTTPDTADYALK